MIDLLGRALARWLERRTGLARFAHRALNHVFPDHWSFMIGEIAFYSFMILVITGTFLAMFYHSSSAKVVYHGSYRALDGVQVSAAYQSVLRLSFDVPAGLLIRQMHHWAALIFVAAIVAHVARIFFTAAYRRPRELTWIVGVTLLILAIVNGFLGYSIGGDLLSGAGLRIGYAIMMSVPVIGQWLAFLLLGGHPEPPHRSAALQPPHLPDPCGDRHPHCAAPGSGLAADAHQFSRPRPHQHHHRRLAPLAVLRRQISRSILPSLRPDRDAGRTRADRSCLGLRSLRPHRHHARSPAGLVPGLSRGRNTPFPGLETAYQLSWFPVCSSPPSCSRPFSSAGSTSIPSSTSSSPVTSPTGSTTCCCFHTSSRSTPL